MIIDIDSFISWAQFPGWFWEQIQHNFIMQSGIDTPNIIVQSSAIRQTCLIISRCPAIFTIIGPFFAMLEIAKTSWLQAAGS